MSGRTTGTTRATVVAAFALIVPFATSVVADDTSWYYRGYFELYGNGRSVSPISVVNPDDFGQVGTSDSELRFDINLGWRHKGFELYAETYAFGDPDGTDTDGDLYQGYASYTTKNQRLFLRAGKIIPAWGVGNVWNPIRTFENQRELLLPDTAIEGVEAFEVQYTLDRVSLTALALRPQTEGDAWRYAVRASSAYKDFDYAISALGSDDGDWQFGAEMSQIFGRFSLVGELVYGNQSNTLFVTDAGFEQARGRGDYFSYVLGFNLQLPKDLLLIVEHLHDDEAFDQRDFDNFLRDPSGHFLLWDFFGNGRDKFYAGLRKTLLWRDSTLQGEAFHEPQSGTNVLQLKADARLVRDLRLSIAAFTVMESRSDVPPLRVLDDAVQVRLRWSF